MSNYVNSMFGFILILFGRTFSVAGFFYNNLSFARIRPALRQMLRQQKDITGVKQARFRGLWGFSHIINITVLYMCIYFVTCRC